MVQAARESKDVIISYRAEPSDQASITKPTDYARVLIVLLDGAIVADQQADHSAWTDAETAAEKLMPLYC